MPKYRCQDGRRNNRPPVKNQFKPGQSGNKKGRPSNKAEKSNEMVARLLRTKHPVVVRGRQEMITAREIIFRRRIELAMKGDAKAIEWVMEQNVEIVEAERVKQPDMTELRKRLENMTEEELDAEYRLAVEENIADFGPPR